MITLHTAVTDSGLQSLILLEELGLPYLLQRRDTQDTTQPVPCIHDDSNDLTLHTSGAILLYLAEKTRRLLPIMPQARACAYEWLFAQAAIPDELSDGDLIRTRLGKQNDALGERDYLVGEFSLADITCYPFAKRYTASLACDRWPALGSWLKRMDARPAVRAAQTKLGGT